MSDGSLPIVAIVGRPNVGKSTLFNRLVGSRRAIIDDAAGTTRDRIYGEAEWQGRRFTVIDTGGLVDPDSGLADHINAQVKQAVQEADLVLFLFDTAAGVTPADTEVGEYLRKSGRPVQVVGNKADNPDRERSGVEAWEIGLGKPLLVSAHHGRGTGDLLEHVLTKLDAPFEPVKQSDTPRLALIGRSNVGKSTLFNRLAGSATRITSAEPDTTRDIGSVTLRLEHGPLILLDTAGIKRRGKSGRGIAKFSLLRTLRAIGESDVVALMVDAEEGPTVQDAHIASYILEAGKSLVLVVNKWDTVEKAGDVQDEWFAKLGKTFAFLPQPPVVFLSALTGAKVDRLFRAVRDVYEAAGTRVETGELNRFVRDTMIGPSGQGRKAARLYYLTQVSARPPTFVCFVNQASLWKPNQRRQLENALRERYGLVGTPVVLKFRSRKPSEKAAV